jgi:hypothetical protein
MCACAPPTGTPRHATCPARHPAVAVVHAVPRGPASRASLAGMTRRDAPRRCDHSGLAAYPCAWGGLKQTRLKRTARTDLAPSRGRSRAALWHIGRVDAASAPGIVCQSVKRRLPLPHRHGTGLTPATSARDGAHPCHIGTGLGSPLHGTGLTPSRDWAHPMPGSHSTRHSCRARSAPAGTRCDEASGRV